MEFSWIFESLASIFACLSSSLIINLCRDILESFEFEQLFLLLVPFEVWSFDKLLGLHLCTGVADLDTIELWLANFFVHFDISIPILQLMWGDFSKVVANDSIDLSLRTVRPSKGKLFGWKRDLHSTRLESIHAERNPVIIAFSVFAVLRGCNLSIDNCLVV